MVYGVKYRKKYLKRIMQAELKYGEIKTIIIYIYIYMHQ